MIPRLVDEIPVPGGCGLLREGISRVGDAPNCDQGKTDSAGG